MRNYATILLMSGAALLAAGCGKQGPEGKFPRNPGDPVVFSVGANAETRTEYRPQETYTTGEKQSIDWLSGDKIRVYSPDATRAAWNQPEHWADYTVTPTATDKSKGTISHVGAYGLAWTDAGNHTFYAVYPSPETEEDDEPADGIAGRFNLTIPSVQAPAKNAQGEYALMDKAFMTAAAAQGAGSDGDAVELDFYPAFTAYEFQFTGEEEELTMNSVTIETSAEDVFLSGDFTVSYSGTTASYSCTGTGKSVTLTFPAGTVLSKEKPVRCTLLALPATARDITLTLVRTYKGTPITNRLGLKRANGEFLTFDQACRKYIFTGLVTPIQLQLTTFDVTTGSWETWNQTNTVLTN